MKPNLYSNTVKELFSYGTGRNNEYKLENIKQKLKTQKTTKLKDFKT